MRRGTILVLAAALCACASGGRLRSSPAVGGAEGEVRYGRTQDDDVVIDLTVEHLRAPERLEPPGWAYVAWARGSSGSPLNLGPLSVSRGRHATLRAVTQLRNFDLFVTAEPAADVESPSGEPLLWASRHE